MRTLAIDLGTRRVGLALSDAGATLATPYDVLQVKSPKGIVEDIEKVIREEGVERLVIGLPLNMDDTIGPAARQTLAWGKQFGERVKLPIIFVDERLSSFEAEQSLAERKREGERLTRGRKKAQQDALAATVFLAAYLVGRLKPLQVPF